MTVALMRVVGVIVLVLSPALAVATHWAARRDMEAVGRLPRPITPVDSQTYSRLNYHVVIAEGQLAGRWSPTGYAALGVTGTLLGVALLIGSGRVRRLTGSRGASAPPDS